MGIRRILSMCVGLWRDGLGNKCGSTIQLKNFLGRGNFTCEGPWMTPDGRYKGALLER
jgi:hypothetical protein